MKHPAFVLGWNDKRAGRSFDPRYEAASITGQDLYETGRQFAAFCLATGREIDLLDGTGWPTLGAIVALRVSIERGYVHMKKAAA